MREVGSSEETSFAVLNRALELGINFIDTADVCGDDGRSERLLGAWFERNQQPPAGSRITEWKDRFGLFDKERNWRIIDAVRAVAAETAATPAAVSLAWLSAQPHVTSSIFGARTVAQLEENVKATELTLTLAHVKQLDEASSYELGYPYAFMKQIQGSW